MAVRVYQNIRLNTGEKFTLEKPAAHHLSRVLRLKDKCRIIIFNGDGYNYSAELIIDRKKITAHILDKKPANTQSSLNITLLQGISKGDRMDMVMQKSVELGVSKIIPVICQRTVVNLKNDRAEKKMRHWQGIVIHACEQSGRASLPLIEEPVKLTEALSLLPKEQTCMTLDPESNKSISGLQSVNNQFSLLVGPEGGLTDEELEQTNKTGFQGVNMGHRILRTETAALASITAIQTLWGDFNSIQT